MTSTPMTPEEILQDNQELFRILEEAGFSPDYEASLCHSYLLQSPSGKRRPNYALQIRIPLAFRSYMASSGMSGRSLLTSDMSEALRLRLPTLVEWIADLDNNIAHDRKPRPRRSSKPPRRMKGKATVLPRTVRPSSEGTAIEFPSKGRVVELWEKHASINPSDHP